MDKVKVTVRLSSKEHAHLKKQADNAGLKMEPYIRRLIAGKEISPRPPEEYYKQHQSDCPCCKLRAEYNNE